VLAPAPPDIAPCAFGLIAIAGGAAVPAELGFETAPAPPASALAVLPGEAPGWVTTGALGPAVGAGAGVAVCASARPVDIKRAAEPSQKERMMVSFNDY
jgi:hypothetical protein